MFERILDGLPEMARAARLLYEPASGGYHLPQRDEQQPFGLDDVERMRVEHATPQYDCVEAPVADLLASLIVNTRARLILETGTSRGFSTSHLAAAARCVHGDAARVVSLDVEAVPNRFFVGAEAARSIDARCVDSLSQDPAELAEGGEFDFLFLDSLHSYRHLGDEVARFLPRLKLGGMLALHDTFFYDGLGLVTLHLMQHPALEVVSLPTHRIHAKHLRSPGVTLMRKVAPVAPGSLVLPGRRPELMRELVNIDDVPALLAEIGTGALQPRYTAGQMAAQGAGADRRTARSAALLEPAGTAATPMPAWVAAEAAAKAAALAANGDATPAANAPNAPGLPDAVRRMLPRLSFPMPRPAAQATPAQPAAPVLPMPPATPVAPGVPPAPVAADEPSRRPSATSALRVRAFKAQAAGEIDKAIGLLQSALAVSPGHPDVICDLASMALATGEPVAAVTLARRALEAAPDHPVALFTLGMALAQGGATAPAIRALQRVAEGEGAAALRAEAAALADQVAPMLDKLRAAQPA